ncbi:OmpW/AlkL family protein [Caballeronia calidae]|uniref:OmpW/AlkL family protein n=1 Tax=Caballeronia calidae TaxID=1777139 RepID=UPI001E632645|nr:OmpW family outer membrane protein [Caballeronia calidae]
MHAQQAGDTLITFGGAWMDFANSSASELQSSSLAGTFSSPGTTAEVHNAFTAQLLLSHFITDHIALDATFGVPPELTLAAQGNAMPLGAGGPQWFLAQYQPLLCVRAWPLTASIKYYLGSAMSRLRPFVGVGANYTWYSHVQLNEGLSQALQGVAGANNLIKTSLSPSWNPVFMIGASYRLGQRWYAITSISYVPLKTNATVEVQSSDGVAVLSNRVRVTANPIVVSLGIGYRF